MRNILNIFRREFFAYFNSPIAYIFVIVFLLVNAGLFTATFFFMTVVEMRYFFSILPITLAVFMPAVTMKMWAEERRTGTIGLLLSFPAKNQELVLGKFLASFVFYLVSLGGTVTIPVILALSGEPDWGPVIGGYVGSILLGAFFLSVGLFVSVLFKEQILAFIIAMVICFAFYLLGTNVVAMPLDGWTGGLGTAIKNTVGLAARFESIERGVLAAGDVLYFLSFTAAFLLLNVYAIESRIRMHGGRLFPAGVAVVLTIAVVINVLTAEMGFLRFDMTETGLYSLSPTTGKILAGFKAPIKVRYYVSPSDRLPTAMKNIQRDVGDILDEFAVSSDNFTYEVIDPTGDVETQRKLQEKNIIPFMTQSVQRDARETRLVYSTISITYLDRPEEVIPHIIPSTLGQLEYEIVSRVYRMTLESKPAVAIYAPAQYADPRMRDENFRKLLAQMGRPVPPPDDRYLRVKELLRQEGYEVLETDLKGASKVPEKAGALLVFALEKLEPAQVKKIEDFVAQGKNLVIAVQKYTYSYSPSPDGRINATPSKTDTGVDALLRKFGVSMPDNILMDLRCDIVRMQVTRMLGQGMYRTGSEPVKFPMQIMVPEQGMNKETGITDRLAGLFYIWGGALELNEKTLSSAGLQARTLFWSSADSWAIPGKTAQLLPPDVDPQHHKMEGPKNLAVYITGPAPGAKDKSKETKIIIIGSAEMFSDNFLAARSNTTLLLNAADALTLGEDLISVRSKGDVMRMKRTLTDGEKIFYRFLALGLVPIVFAALGITRSVIRRRRRAAYLRRFSR